MLKGAYLLFTFKDRCRYNRKRANFAKFLPKFCRSAVVSPPVQRADPGRCWQVHDKIALIFSRTFFIAAIEMHIDSHKSIQNSWASCRPVSKMSGLDLGAAEVGRYYICMRTCWNPRLAVSISFHMIKDFFQSACKDLWESSKTSNVKSLFLNWILSCSLKRCCIHLVIFGNWMFTFSNSSQAFPSTAKYSFYSSENKLHVGISSYSTQDCMFVAGTCISLPIVTERKLTWIILGICKWPRHTHPHTHTPRPTHALTTSTSHPPTHPATRRVFPLFLIEHRMFSCFQISCGSRKQGARKCCAKG